MGLFGDDCMDAGSGSDTIRVGIGNNIIIAGRGFDTTIFEDRPVDYTFSKDTEGRLVANNKAHAKESTLADAVLFSVLIWIH